MSSQYEEEIIRLFIEKERKERFLLKFSHPGGREWLKSTLWNAIYFEPRCMTQLPKKPKAEELYALLKAKGSGDKAYMLTNLESDGQIIPLLDALKAFIGEANGTLVYCIEGQVGYYEADGWKGYFIIHKADKTSKKS